MRSTGDPNLNLWTWNRKTKIKQSGPVSLLSQFVAFASQSWPQHHFISWEEKNWFWMLHQLINLHWWHCLVFQPFHKHFAKARIFFLLPSLEHVSCKNNIQPVEISFVNAPFCCCNGRIKPCGTLTMNGLASKVFACLGCKYREMLWQNWIGLLQEFQKCQFYIYTREGGCNAAMLKVFPGLHSADILWPPCWIPFVASSFCLAFANRHCVLAQPRSCNFVNLLEPFSTCLKLYWPS